MSFESIMASFEEEDANAVPAPINARRGHGTRIRHQIINMILAAVVTVGGPKKDPSNMFVQ